MPIPRPVKDEEHEQFIERCMVDESMVQEFSKLGQRYAVCQVQWEHKDDDDDTEEDDDEKDDEEEEDIDDEYISVIIERIAKATNFPQRGDDETISLQNSKYDLFPIEFAERVKENYPKVWNLGGNILGNEQYRHLYDIRTGDVSADDLTPRQIEAIRLREAWSARHYENNRIKGIIAQIKWHLVGSIGIDAMKKLVNEEIKKRYGGDE